MTIMPCLLLDQLILVQTIIFIDTLQTISLVSSLNCDKSFTYYEEYGQNSFNVTCSGITKGYEHILENITINNEISLTVTDSILENITPNIFKNVQNIKMLNMFNCTFDYDRKLAIFEKLEKLEVLSIKDTYFEIENVAFRGLSALKALELENNSISVIEKGGFKYLVNLEKLEIVDNHVKNLSDLQLCELTKLKYLNLRHNMINNLKSFYFFCLKNRRSLDFNINNKPALPNIYETSYFNITNIVYDLVDLDLSYNQIVDIGYSLEDLGKLKTLNLGNNKLLTIKYLHLKGLSRIQKIYLNNNEIRTCDSRIFGNKTQLNLVDLSHNILSSFAIADAPELQFLNLGHNIMSTISLNNLRRLKKLDVRFNKIKLYDNSFCDVPNLVSLNLAGNNVTLRSGLFKNLTGLKYLNLSNNSLYSVTEKVFLGLKYLKTLDLSFNNLQNLNGNTFYDLENLELLNLSSNSIETLTYDMVEPLDNLRTLDLSANKLAYIEYDVILSKLPTLSNINIKSNQLTCENLGKIVIFLKQKHIVYTNSENLDLNNLDQNVAGIPCRSAASTNRLVVTVEPKSSSSVTLFNFGIFLIVIFVSILTGIVSYRFYVYLKRRRYRADEFELVVD